jgi:membrane protease YdiL (CAAX protease family)
MLFVSFILKNSQMKSSESIAVFAIAATLILSLIYFLVLDILRDKQAKAGRAGILSFFGWRKFIGFFLFGIITAVGAWLIFHLDPVHFGLTWGDSSKLWPWIVGASGFFIGLNILNSRNKDLQAVYPEMRLASWNSWRIIFAAAGWLLYLAGYEFLFRGVLLMSCYEAWGLWPAVVINLALYSALHLPKGLKEATAAIPFGALICYLTIESQSILPAILIHTLQAVSCEIACMVRNPEMKITFVKN